MDDGEQPPVEYVSYNGLGRNPGVWGVPYMAGLGIVCTSFMGGMLLGTFVARAGWLFVLVGVPIVLFVKLICANDDGAVGILALEAKWMLIKALSGNAKYYGGTLTIAPTTYGRRLKDAQRYFAKTVGR